MKPIASLSLDLGSRPGGVGSRVRRENLVTGDCGGQDDRSKCEESELE